MTTLLLLLACTPQTLPDSDKAPADSGTLSTDSGTLPTDSGESEDDARVRALTGLPSGENPCQEPILGRVSEVVDGDTFWIHRDDDGSSLKIRIIGVDTPEIAHPEYDEPEGDCYGDEAWTHTRERIEEKLVWLTFDEECLDYYERTLAYAFTDNTDDGFLNRHLARNGYATQLTVYPNDAFEAEITGDVAAAEDEGLGLWGACEG